MTARWLHGLHYNKQAGEVAPVGGSGTHGSPKVEQFFLIKEVQLVHRGGYSAEKGALRYRTQQQAAALCSR